MGGLTADEAKSWWNKHHPQSSQDERDWANDITGRIPLWMSRVSDSKILNISSPAIAEIEDLVLSFLMHIDNTQPPNIVRTMLGYLRSFLLQDSISPYASENILHLLDHRFMHINASRIGIFTCPLAIATAMRLAQKANRSLLDPEDYIKIISLFPDNPFVKGYTIEAAIISSIRRTGARKMNEELTEYRARDRFFPGLMTAVNHSAAHPVLYVPERINYPAIDALLVVTELPSGGQHIMTYYPIKITINKADHGDSEAKFAESWCEWTKDLPPRRRAIMEFVWITPKSEKEDEGRVKPIGKYKIHNLSFGDIEPKLKQVGF